MPTRFDTKSITTVGIILCYVQYVDSALLLYIYIYIYIYSVECIHVCTIYMNVLLLK